MTEYNAQELVKLGGREITLYSGVVTASGNSRTSPKNVLPYKEATLFLRVSAVGGAGTFDVTVESKDPAGAYYEDLQAFTQIAAVGGEKKDVAANLGSNLTLSWTLATFTSVTFSVIAVCK